MVVVVIMVVAALGVWIVQPAAGPTKAHRNASEEPPGGIVPLASAVSVVCGLFWHAGFGDTDATIVAPGETVTMREPIAPHPAGVVTVTVYVVVVAGLTWIVWVVAPVDHE